MEKTSPTTLSLDQLDLTERIAEAPINLSPTYPSILNTPRLSPSILGRPAHFSLNPSPIAPINNTMSQVSATSVARSLFKPSLGTPPAAEAMTLLTSLAALHQPRGELCKPLPTRQPHRSQ